MGSKSGNVPVKKSQIQSGDCEYEFKLTDFDPDFHKEMFLTPDSVSSINSSDMADPGHNDSHNDPNDDTQTEETSSPVSVSTDISRMSQNRISASTSVTSTSSSISYTNQKPDFIAASEVEQILKTRRVNEELFYDYYSRRFFSNPMVKSVKQMRSKETFDKAQKGSGQKSSEIERNSRRARRDLEEELRTLYSLDEDRQNRQAKHRKHNLKMYQYESVLFPDQVRPALLTSRSTRKPNDINMAKVLLQDHEIFALLNSELIKCDLEHKKEFLIEDSKYVEYLANNFPYRTVHLNQQPVQKTQIIPQTKAQQRRNEAMKRVKHVDSFSPESFELPSCTQSSPGVTYNSVNSDSTAALQKYSSLFDD